eukprot:m.291448 g.291448  ORF g.291448 m.291448 type:complete len:372 (+) comp12470_c0_seq1:63-1178(+)
MAAFLRGKLEGSSGQQAELWGQVENLYSRKHWHQLTEALLALVAAHPAEAEPVYSQFVREFEDRLNKESLARLILAAAGQASSATDAIQFIENVQTKAAADSTAKIILNSAQAHYHLLNQDSASAKKLLAACEEQLGEVDGVSPMHADYYRVLAEMHKINGEFAEFYTAALKYLGCVEIESISVVDQVQRAYDLGLAALLGDGIYNFGELLAHPILDALRGTDKEWLVELLSAFNEGDLPRVNALGASWQAQADLNNRREFLDEKIRLLALMELVFKAPAQNRTLSFAQIAEKTQLPLDMVELLVMRALSLGLVKGTIDEVEQAALLHWVQPRVLSIQQLAGMRDKLAAWIDKVDTVALDMEQRAPELFVQ